MLIQCSKLQNDWDSILKTSSEMLEMNLKPCPLITVFGIPEDLLSLDPKHSHIVSFTSLLA
jgi:hypothetical protein